MPVQAITYAEMMQSQTILGIVNRIQTPLSFFQRFFNRMSGDNSVATDIVKGRDAGWDIYDSTRRFAGARAPNTPPRRVSKHVIGHGAAQLMRSHESIMVFDNEVYKGRALGGQYGTLDLMGMKYIQRQITTMTTTFRNQREWMYSRMLRGGFNLVPDGDNYSFAEYNASATGQIPVNYQLPADHQTRCQLGTGSNILTDWSSAAADIPGQMYKINKAFSRIHGRALKHVIVNSTTFTNIQNCTKLHTIGGDAYRIFDSMTRRELKSKEGIPDSGFDVVFRALPLFTFHVYDGVLSADGRTDGTSTTDMTLLVPDNYAIFLPDPDDWEGLIVGTEVIGETVVAAPREAVGFTSWATRVIDPPGFEMKFLDNYLPVLYNPQCIAYGYVGT